MNLLPIFILGVATIGVAEGGAAALDLQIGVAAVDITPPEKYPVSGYYHERLSTGVRDPLWAKAVVFRQGDQEAAIVVCDLIAVFADLSSEVRQRAETQTGIPASNIVVAATHTHTGPDYSKDLYAYVSGPRASDGSDKTKPYAGRLIDGVTESIVRARAAMRPAKIETTVARQGTPVSFNRRFLLKDGSVKTWANFRDPSVVRSAGPIDPEVGFVLVRDAEKKTPLMTLTNFALHLDTVGGALWSADYPYWIEQSLREQLGSDLVSIFGTGCCGNINHVDPSREERNDTKTIGSALARTVIAELPRLQPVESPTLQVRSAMVRARLQQVTPERLAWAKDLLRRVKAGEQAPFLDHVDAYKLVVLDHLRNKPKTAEPSDLVTWGLSATLSGSGDELPLEVHTIALGRDLAIVTLPGEMFTEFGLAIKNASPFRTTLVIELANISEVIYVPTRYAYTGGGYEVTNSMLAPGGGELLAAEAIRQLRDIAESSAQESPKSSARK